MALAYQGCPDGRRTGQVNLACAGQQWWTGGQVGRSTLLTRAVVLGRGHDRRMSRTRAEVWGRGQVGRSILLTRAEVWGRGRVGRSTLLTRAEVLGRGHDRRMSLTRAEFRGGDRTGGSCSCRAVTTSLTSNMHATVGMPQQAVDPTTNTAAHPYPYP